VNNSSVKLSVIIPVYNEEATILQVIEAVRAVPINKEILVINDGSTDKTGEVLLGQKDITVFNSPINLGKGAAIRIGYKLASGDIVLIQDADLELSPTEYPRLIKPILENKTEVVYGSRFLENNNSVGWSNKVGNFVITNFFNLLYGRHLTDLSTCFKVLKINVAKSLKLTANRFEIEPEITLKLARAGVRILEVPVNYVPRSCAEGKKIKYFKDGLQYLLTLLKGRFAR